MDDVAIVAQQIGRPPRGAVTVAARCAYGLPVVIKTSAQLDDGTPFPTVYYLTCPVAVRDIGRLEASGLMREYQDRLAVDEDLARAYEEAHDRYVRARDGVPAAEGSVSAGGMPDRVKCLHALYAHEAVDENPIGARVADIIEPLACPGVCVAGDPLRPVLGHPGSKGKRTS